MTIDEARFRQVLGYFASGVTVVTTAHAGRNYGLTVSSFSSLSLRPPLVLVCIDKRVSSYEPLTEAAGFTINILEKGQEHISRKFAAPDDDKFAGIAWHPGILGHPVIEDALAVIECRTHVQLPGGDHTIFVGEVVEATLGAGSPLLYFRRGYHELK